MLILTKCITEEYQVDPLRTPLKEYLIPFEYFCGFSDLVFDTLRGNLAKSINGHPFKVKQSLKPFY